MKYALLLFIATVTIAVKAQNPLNFNKRFVESENKWVAIKTDKDSIYEYSYVYMDTLSGLLVKPCGIFKITKNNTFITTTKGVTGLTFGWTAQGDSANKAWVPSNKLKELNEPDRPNWLANYKVDTTSAAWLFKWGIVYMVGNETDKASYYLDRVKKIAPNYPGLEFQYILLNNATGQYDKAITLILKSLKTKPDNFRLYEELIFAQVRSNQLNKAEVTYKLGLDHCPFITRGDMAYNIAYAYYQQKNKSKFNFWAEEASWFIMQNDSRKQDLLKLKAILNK